jgi:hypothetical protein
MDYTEEQDLPRVSLREVTDLCLRFPDEDTATAVLYADEVPLFRNIDTIGVIYKPTGSTIVLEDGTESPEMAAVTGWHVNVRVMPDEDIEDLEPYKVNPEPLTPVRVWV